jgi:hypothetical protein
MQFIVFLKNYTQENEILSKFFIRQLMLKWIILKTY